MPRGCMTMKVGFWHFLAEEGEGSAHLEPMREGSLEGFSGVAHSEPCPLSWDPSTCASSQGISCQQPLLACSSHTFLYSLAPCSQVFLLNIMGNFFSGHSFSALVMIKMFISVIFLSSL